MLAARNGARGRSCTCTGCALDAVPLLLGYASLKMAPVAGLAPTRTRLKGEALGSLHSRAKESSRQDSHLDCALI